MFNFRKVKPRTAGGDMPMAESPMKKRKIYPNIQIPLSALPEAEKWPPGKTYHVALELTMTELRVRKGDGVQDEWGNQASFDVKGVAVLKNKNKGGKVARFASKEKE